MKHNNKQVTISENREIRVTKVKTLMSILDMSVESEQETVNPYDKTRGPSDLKPSNKENHVKRGEFIMVAWRKLMAKYPHFREALNIN